MDLSPYKSINPCGYSDLKVTKMCHLTNNTLRISNIQRELSEHLIHYITRTQN